MKKRVSIDRKTQGSNLVSLFFLFSRSNQTRIHRMKRMRTESTDVANAAPAELLNRQDFVDMNRGAVTYLSSSQLPALTFAASAEMHEYDEMREKIIKRSREILKARYGVNYPGTPPENATAAEFATLMHPHDATTTQQAGDLRVASCGQSGSLEAAGQCGEGEDHRQL